MSSKDLENSPRFRAFLVAFGVKGIEEYKTFTRTEKLICIREYLKDIKGKRH